MIMVVMKEKEEKMLKTTNVAAKVINQVQFDVYQTMRFGIALQLLLNFSLKIYSSVTTESVGTEHFL